MLFILVFNALRRLIVHVSHERRARGARAEPVSAPLAGGSRARARVTAGAREREQADAIDGCVR